LKKRRRGMLVVEHGVNLEAYTLLRKIFSKWKDSSAPFLLPRPLSYKESTATLERTWIKGKPVSVLYFLMPEPLSRIAYSMEPSIFVEKSAEFLAWLHNLEVKFNNPSLKALREGHVNKMQTIVDDCLKRQLIKRDVAEGIKSEVDRLFRHGEWGPVSIIHGDFKTQNVLITEKNIAIIDFDTTRYDFSYLDLARFAYNIKLRSNKYPLPLENRVEHWNFIFLRKYEELCGNANRTALKTCYFRALLEELKTVYISYSTKARSLKENVSFFLIRRNFNYIIKELKSLGIIKNVHKT